ncbi:MAG: hypothetical protein ABEJ73_01145 [Haloplanus sp.]
MSVVERLAARHGPFLAAAAVQLVVDHSRGEMTIRQISSLTGLPSDETHAFVEEVYDDLDLADSSVTTYTA